MLGASAWLAVGPALIAGAIGLVSAALSFSMARLALRNSELESQRQRAHQRDLLIWPKLLSAAEQTWAVIYTLERTGVLTEAMRDELVAASMWLPPLAQEQTLRLTLQYERDPDGGAVDNALLKEVRRLLLDAAGISDGVNPSKAASSEWRQDQGEPK